MKQFIILLCIFASSVLTAQQKNSPYLSVTSKDGVIPLKASAADVQISGTVAHVQIKQTYHNQGAPNMSFLWRSKRRYIKCKWR